jgi:hypothetical protein
MLIIKSVFIAMAMVVNKALLPLFTTKGLNSGQIYTKATTVTNAIETNSVTFGVMSPTTADMLINIVAGQTLNTEIEALRLQILTKEQQRDENLAQVVSDMTYKYCPSVKTTANGVKSIVDLSGLICKGFGVPKTLDRFNNTFPEPFKIDQNIGLRIILNLMASDALSKGKVYGAKSIMCYRQVGGIPPQKNNHPLAKSLVPFSKMKLTGTDFDTTMVGQTVYYIFCWVDKDGNLGNESSVYAYVITA